MQAVLLSLYGLSGVMIISGICLSVQSTLNQAIGLPVRFKILGLFLRIIGLALLCFLILKYREKTLLWGLCVFFAVSFILLLYFSLVRRSSIR